MVKQVSGEESRVADCLVRAATDILSHRWDGVVLAVLGTGPRRRVELRAAIGQVKDKPLSEALARLSAANLILRRVNETPPSQVYELTLLGQTFHDGPLRALASWAQEYSEGLLEQGYRG